MYQAIKTGNRPVIIARGKEVRLFSDQLEASKYYALIDSGRMYSLRFINNRLTLYRVRKGQQ